MKYSADPSNLQHQISKLRPGDTLELQAGDYKKQYDLRSVQGTPDDWITIEGNVNTLFKCDNFSHMGFHTHNTRYVNIRHTEFYGHHHPIYMKGTGTHDINLEHCEFHHFLGPVGISDGCYNVTNTKCKFHDVGKGTNNLYNVMNGGTSCKNIVWDECEFYDQKYHGSINFGHHDTVPHLDMKILNCYFHDNTGGDNIFTNDCHLDGAIITGNIIENGNWGGIRCNLKNSYVANNIIRNLGYWQNGTPKGTGTVWLGWWFKNDNNIFERNTIENCKAGTAGFYGFDIFNGNNNTLISNRVRDQRGLTYLREGTHIIYDPYDNDIIKLNGTAYIRYSDNRDFKVTGVSASSIRHYNNYSEIKIQSNGGEARIETSSPPPDPVPDPDPNPDPDPDPDPEPDPDPDPSPGKLMIPNQSEWKDQGVILSAGDEGEWDVRLEGMLSPCLCLKKDDTFFLYYIGSSGDRTAPHTDKGPAHRKLGVATSTDGVHYTKHPDNPILEFSPNDNEEEGIFSVGGFINSDGRIVIYYGAMDSGSNPSSTWVCGDIRIAVSSNGVDFKDEGEVVNHKDSSVFGYGDELFPIGAYRNGSYTNVYYTIGGHKQYNRALGVVYGQGNKSLNTSKKVLVHTDRVDGGCNPVEVDEDTIALFLAIDKKDSGPSYVEVRTAKKDTPHELSSPVKIYNFDTHDITTFYDREHNEWYFYYLQKGDNSIKCKTCTGHVPDPVYSCGGIVDTDLALLKQYDVNYNGRIDTVEIQKAIADKSDGVISDTDLDKLTFFWENDCQFDPEEPDPDPEPDPSPFKDVDIAVIVGGVIIGYLVWKGA